MCLQCTYKTFTVSIFWLCNVYRIILLFCSINLWTTVFRVLVKKRLPRYSIFSTPTEGSTYRYVYDFAFHSSKYDNILYFVTALGIAMWQTDKSEIYIYIFTNSLSPQRKKVYSVMHVCIRTMDWQLIQ